MTEIGDLAVGASALGVLLQEEQLDQLLRFAALLRRWNTAFNLVSHRDIGRLIPRHLLDSLSLAPLLRGGRALDMGTGAGLPGVPLAISCPGMTFTLVDRNQRRIRFVRQAVFELKLANVDAIAADFSGFRPVVLFDTVLSRAVTTPAMLWRAAAPLLAPGGQALLQIGAGTNDFASDTASVEHIDIRIPGLASSRHLLRITRRRATSGS